MAIYRLKNPIQNYPWGSTTDIPKLLGAGNPNHEPVAELWLGAHPKAPSTVLSEQGEQSLLDLIEAEPEAILGADTVDRFGPRLPFLLKVLAAEKALALQVHPTGDQAKDGFEKENALGIRLDAPERNYLDRNHKPEMLCALEPFECLAGFRGIGQIATELRSLHLTTFAEEIDYFGKSRSIDGLKSLFESIMLLESERKKRFVQEVVERATVSKGVRYRWIVELNQQYPGDIGVVSPLFLNLLHLRTGQAVYLASGTVHAYLRGVAIELMSNSDNVVRGGLSVRHVDIPEFMRILRYNESPIEPINPKKLSRGAEVYEIPTSDFCLYRIRLNRGVKYVSSGKRAVEILICTRGKAVLKGGADQDDLVIHRGDSFLIQADVAEYMLEGEATLFVAGVR
jgi:mannose-6-phosphate isomerase